MEVFANIAILNNLKDVLLNTDVATKAKQLRNNKDDLKDDNTQVFIFLEGESYNEPSNTKEHYAVHVNGKNIGSPWSGEFDDLYQVMNFLMDIGEALVLLEHNGINTMFPNGLHVTNTSRMGVLIDGDK